MYSVGSLSGVTPANSVCLRIMSSVPQGANAVKEGRRLIIVRNRTFEVWGRKKRSSWRVDDEGGVVGYSSGNGLLLCTLCLSNNAHGRKERKISDHLVTTKRRHENEEELQRLSSGSA